jgi:hypothetical protein
MIPPKTAMDILVENTLYQMRQKARRDLVTKTDLASRTRDVCDRLARYGGAVATPELAAVLEALTDLNDNLHHDRDAMIGQEQVRLIIHLLYVLAEAEGFDGRPTR